MVGQQAKKEPPRSDQPSVDLRPRRFLIAIIILSVILRVGVALYLGDTVPPAKDEMSYSALAERLATGHGYSFPTPWYPFALADAPTSHWSFLYTAFVAGVYAVFGPHPLAARLVQAVAAGVLMPWVTWRLAKRLPVEGYRLKVVPLIAAGLSAGYAYFVLYGAMVQTEAFFICALVWSLERGLAVAERMEEGAPPAVAKKKEDSSTDLVLGLSFGLSLGVATLLRQSILPWVAVLFVWLLWTGWKVEGWKVGRLGRAVGPLVVAGVVMVGCIVPFTVRNWLVYDGNFLLLNSNAGYAMYAAQHPLHGTSFGEYRNMPLPEDIDPAMMNEATWDKELMRRGIGFVLAEPGRYLLLSLSRVRDYVEFWPTRDSSTLFNVGRVASIGIMLPFMVYGLYLALLGTGRQTFNLQPSIFLAVFMAFYSLLHIFTWAMSRYRLPVDAVALVFAALAISDLAQRLWPGKFSRWLPSS